MSPYDSIAMTAACVDIPPPLIEQLRVGGRLIAPLLKKGAQDLILLEKGLKGVQRRVICEVLYVSLRGIYGS
jgi:protein-L-isoaspartate(D-aspartate) O-methyltransferase